MKIALSGLNPDKSKKLIIEVQKLWPNYVSPTKSIFDEEIEFPSDKSNYHIYQSLNEVEKDNFARWQLLHDQYEKYKNQKHIIYNGSPIDLLVAGMVLRANEEMSSDYIAKTIGYFKSYMKKLDLIYWMPNENGLDGLDEVDTDAERVYNGIYDQYRNHFDKSIYFDANNCSAFVRFNTTNYIEEMKLLLDHNGNLFGSDTNEHNLNDSVKAQELFKGNPMALKILLQGEEDRKSGNIQI